MQDRLQSWCRIIGAVALIGCGTGRTETAETDAELPSPSVERGRYLVEVSGCNDCHTSGYLMADGEVPEEQWLLGDGFGWRGPWGTTYASNLRLFTSRMTEDEWVEAARTMRRRPPMPWFNLNAMAEADLRSIYRFTRSLGEPGEAAPAALPPGEEPPMPYASFPTPPGDDDPRTLVVHMYEEFDAGRLNDFRAAVSPDFEAHVMGTQTYDWGGFEQFSAQFLSAFPDGRHELDTVLVQGGTVVTVGHYRGTHEGELMGIAPTHRELDLPVMHIDRVVDGKLVEHVGMANGSDLMQQLSGR
jgi:predicted ester cyclase